MVEHFERVKKEQERQGLKAEIRDSKGSTQSDYAVEQERRFMLRKQIRKARETYNKIKEENQKQGKPTTAEKTAYDFEKLTNNEILKLHLKENKGR